MISYILSGFEGQVGIWLILFVLPVKFGITINLLTIR